MAVGARQSFQFFRQKTCPTNIPRGFHVETVVSTSFQRGLHVVCLQGGFLKIIEVYLNLGLRFCITWLVLPSYKKIRP